MKVLRRIAAKMPGDKESSPALLGQTIAVTGRFASMSQTELAELVRAAGGAFVETPGRSTTLVVIGQDGWPLREDGSPTQTLLRARQLQAEGYRLTMLTEQEFLERLAGSDGRLQHSPLVHRRYTLAQLSRVLGVAGDRIRAWVRAGIIAPVETQQRLAYFDYAQVAGARTLVELAQRGVGLSRIRESLEQLRAWLPDVQRPLSQLSILQRDGRLLVRLQGGRIAEPSGQLRFDFMVPVFNQSVAGRISSKSADQWFNEALELEDAGQLQDAASAYLEALRLDGSDPVLHFNLGNLYQRLNQPEAAIEELRLATLLDPGYVEAWNNLGSALAQLKQVDEAIEAFQQALRRVPSYADAHFNLAHTLEQAGRTTEARRHWLAYGRYEPLAARAVEQRLALSPWIPAP